MLQPCSLTFIVSNVKMDYELNYELMTASNLIMEGIKWKIENLFQFLTLFLFKYFIFYTGIFVVL